MLSEDFEGMSLSRLLEERDSLKIRINLLNNGDSTSPDPVSVSVARLAAVEQLVAKKRQRPDA